MSNFRYTEEHKKWFSEHDYFFKTYEEMKDSFNKYFNVNNTRNSIKNYCCSYQIHCSTRFTKEQIAWLQENIKDNYLEDIVKEFNEKFNQERNVGSIATLVWRGTIKKEKNSHSIRNLKKYNNRRKTPKEHIEWLKENRLKYGSISKLVEGFNKEFGTNKNYSQIATMIFTYKIVKVRKTPEKYTKEQKIWCKEHYSDYLRDGYLDVFSYRTDFNKTFNKELKDQHFNNLMRKLGLKLNEKEGIGKQISSQKNKICPLGHEARSGMGREWFVKVDNQYGCSGKHLKNYRKKANIVYEQYHNVKLDDTKDFVVFLNGNRDDFSKDNLYLASKRDIAVYVPKYVVKNSSMALVNDKKLRRIAMLSVQLENKMEEVLKESLK